MHFAGVFTSRTPLLRGHSAAKMWRISAELRATIHQFKTTTLNPRRS
jgi:hypothetical protein